MKLRLVAGDVVDVLSPGGAVESRHRVVRLSGAGQLATLSDGSHWRLSDGCEWRSARTTARREKRRRIAVAPTLSGCAFS